MQIFWIERKSGNSFCLTFLVGAVQSEYECFEQFNTQGSLNGNCGPDNQGGFIKCTEE